jgi:hypothetical protein
MLSVMQSNASAPADYLIAIGSIAISCGHIEANVRDIAQALIDDHGEVGKLLMHRADLNAAERAINALLPVRLADDAAMQRRIGDAVRQGRKIMRRRNDVLHSQWMISGGSATVLLKNDAVVEWPLELLRQLAEESHIVAVEIGRVWFDLLHSWGHFDELERATMQMIAEESS